MKKSLLFIGLLSTTLLQTVAAQTLTYDALPESAQPGSSASFTLSYTSAIPSKIGVDLFVFNVDGSGNLTQDWSTWRAGTATAVLPATDTPSAQTFTLSIPGSLELSSALPAGKTYVWSLALRDANDGWITGSQVATTITATTGAVNAVHFEGTAATLVNAGSTAVIAYSYTLVNDGIVKVALSKYNAQELWMNDIATYIADPAIATGITPMIATANLTVPADVVPSAQLTNGETYKWEVSIFSAGWSSYLGGVKSNVTVDAVAGFDKNAVKAVSIYPNPVSNTLFLSGKAVQQTQVFDLTGKMLISAGAVSGIDVSTLASGVYFLKIDSNNALKFIKK